MLCSFGKQSELLGVCCVDSRGRDANALCVASIYRNRLSSGGLHACLPSQQCKKPAKFRCRLSDIRVTTSFKCTTSLRISPVTCRFRHDVFFTEYDMNFKQKLALGNLAALAWTIRLKFACLSITRACISKNISAL